MCQSSVDGSDDGGRGSVQGRRRHGVQDEARLAADGVPPSPPTPSALPGGRGAGARARRGRRGGAGRCDGDLHHGDVRGLLRVEEAHDEVHHEGAERQESYGGEHQVEEVLEGQHLPVAFVAVLVFDVVVMVILFFGEFVVFFGEFVFRVRFA